MSYIIILKKNKSDIWKNYYNNYFVIIANSSKHDILKYNFINTLITIEKEELINKIKYHVLNNFNYHYLIIIKTFSHLFLNINIIIAFFT